MQPKILYAIQGTGNGHVARARELVPVLQKYADVDVFLSGDQSHLNFPFPIKYKSKGLTFVYDKSGAVNYWKTLWKNNLLRLLWEVFTFPVYKYDLVINDFEFITAWSSRIRGKECLSLSHQCAMLFDQTPRPQKRDWMGWMVLKYYAPAKRRIGFHFKQYEEGIRTPIVKKEIRDAAAYRGKHYTIYLPAFSLKNLVPLFQSFPDYSFHLFSKEVIDVKEMGNVSVHPISTSGFARSFINCRGVVTSAGFETPAEAIYLNKKLLVVPIKGQYEQMMNAEALKRMGVEVLKDLNPPSVSVLKYWLKEEKKIHINYPDEMENLILDEIIPLTQRSESPILFTKEG